jgi:hypothetical protein
MLTSTFDIVTGIYFQIDIEINIELNFNIKSVLEIKSISNCKFNY